MKFEVNPDFKSEYKKEISSFFSKVILLADWYEETEVKCEKFNKDYDHIFALASPYVDRYKKNLPILPEHKEFIFHLQSIVDEFGVFCNRYIASCDINDSFDKTSVKKLKKINSANKNIDRPAILKELENDVKVVLEEKSKRDNELAAVCEKMDELKKKSKILIN
jgi:hypothetical protein